MFEQILNNAIHQNQQQFNIVPFVNKAIELGNNHITITSTIAYLREHYGNLNIGRPELYAIWGDASEPLYVKILTTFWWGGLSHQNQAPLFYNIENLDKLHGMCENMQADLTNINNPNGNFQEGINDLYNRLKLPNGEYKLRGINTAFFSKILQFAISNQIQPIIADKWSTRAILADMINQNHVFNQIFILGGNSANNLTIKFRGSAKNEFQKYYSMLEYFNNRCNQLEINPLVMEEIMFGYGGAGAMQDINNPRVIATNIILNYLN